MLIVFEGIDGCGKETQIILLKQKLQFDLFKFPTRNFGILNDYLEKKASLSSKSLFHLFLADIANEQERVAKSSFAVLDRYFFSTIAYEVDGINYENAKRIVEASGLIKPDLVIYLDITEDISQERKSRQKALDRYEEDKKYLSQVRGNYLKLYDEKFYAHNWHLVDAKSSIETVHQRILEILKGAGVKF